MSIDRPHRRGRRYDRELPRARYCSIESESSSSSQQSSSTNTSTSTSNTNIDRRVAGSEGSINVSGDGVSVAYSNSSIDAGAVNASFGFAREALKNAVDFAIGSATRSSQVLTTALEGVSKSEEKIADAYSTSKAGEQKILVGVVTAIIAVVAVAALRKG